MDHVAILRKARISKNDNLLSDILMGTKTIESRWYVNKISPWDKIHTGDRIFFKESGCPVTAQALVSNVLQFSELNDQTVTFIVNKYGSKISPNTSNERFIAWIKAQKKKKYCILVFLSSVKKVEPFEINKKGFGISSAWLCVNNIKDITL